MSFSDIKGQARPIEIIKEYIKQPSVSRGYLFTGPDGIGKRLLAKTLSKALNCQTQTIDSCDKCPSCLKIEQNQHPDVHLIDDSDSNSIKIEDIRTLQKNINLRPYEGRKNVFIIDNAHNLTSEAANALLKILEEPPKDSLLILVSSKIALLFKTIVSRCQILKFYPMERVLLGDILKNDYGLDDNLVHFLSFFSEGRLGFALKLKDTDIFREKNRIIDEFCIKKNSPRGHLNNFAVADRQKFRAILNILMTWFRDIYLLKSGLPYRQLINLDRKQDLAEAARTYSFFKLDEALNCLSASLLRLEQNINIKLLLSNLKWSLSEATT